MVSGLVGKLASLSAGISSGEFSIGTLISSTFSVLNGAFGKFIALAAIPLIPNLVTIVIGGGTTPADSGRLIITGIASIVSAILAFMIQGAIVFGATNEMRGRPFSIGDALSKGLARFLPLLGVAIVCGVAIVIGFALLIVPGLILLCIWYAAGAVCVVEQRGVFASMSRSAELSKGYRWKILGLLLIVGIATAVVEGVIAGVGRAVGGALVGSLVVLIVQLYATAFGSVLVALVYYCLRSIKEGIDIDRIADVFD